MIKTRILNDPQGLVDNNVQFQVEAPGKGVFTVTLEDGWAAGTAWYLLRFHTGVLQGKVLWLNRTWPEGGFQYVIEAVDDGFLFNSTREDEVVLGGDYLPEWDNVTFYIKE